VISLSADSNSAIAMVVRLRNEYRGVLARNGSLKADPILYDDAHYVYDRLAKDSADKARLWAAIWVYELIISPHQMHYLKWKAADGEGWDFAELLGDFETRRVETNGAGDPLRWTDMEDVTWPEGDRGVLSDQPFDAADAIALGATAIERHEFLTLWAKAAMARQAGTPNPKLSPSVVATFEELRIARGQSG
jgi:hypothetical protein